MNSHRGVLRVFAFTLSLGGALSSRSVGQATQQATPAPTRFQKEIDAYLKTDSTSTPAPGGIVFVGSSIFRLWTSVTKDMAPLPAYNRGFGGSETADVLYYMDRIVLAYRPRFVVYYCGSNDVNSSSSASTIVARIRQFHERLERELPGARMFFVSVIRAPQKRTRWATVDSVNAQMRQYAATAKNVDFIDVNPILLDASGNVQGALYLPDSLHYRPEAYTLFTSVIKPVLERAWSVR